MSLSFSLPLCSPTKGCHGKIYQEVRDKYREPQTIHESFQVRGSYQVFVV